MGLVRYSLTVHFQENDLLHKLWQAAPNRVLVKCIARATGEAWLSSVESDDDYLIRYFERQALRIIDPVDALPETKVPVNKGKHVGIDPVKEAQRQLDSPLASMRWKTMRRTVLDRDKWTCRSCGYTGQDMQIDHVKPRHKWPELTWDMENIQTLCKPCHFAKTGGDYRQWKPEKKVRKRERLSPDEVISILVA
jgi:hypothetical protein